MRNSSTKNAVYESVLPLGKLWDLNPIWGVLTESQREVAMDQVEVRRYRKGEEIHHEGGTPTHMMMLVSGKIKIYKEGVGQRQQIIRLLKPFDFFSYRAVVGGGGYNSSAEAIEDCTVYQLNKECFIRLLKSNNQFCFLVMQNMAGALGTQEAQTVNLTQKHIRGRLAESLLTLKQQRGDDSDVHEP